MSRMNGFVDDKKSFADALSAGVLYVRIEYSAIPPSISERERVKSRILERKDDEPAFHNCFYCGKEFSERDLRVVYDIPLMLGGGLMEDNEVLACLSCLTWKNRVDRIVVKFFKDMLFIGGRRFRCWNNIPLSQVLDYYRLSIVLWRDADRVINNY